MDMLSDEEFDHVRDFDMTDSEGEAEHDTPSTTPPRTHTPANHKIIPCPYDSCTKTFNRNARLQEHIRSHTGERPYKCPHEGCSKAFLRDSHLKHHLTSAHSNIRNYKCTWEDCRKSFATGTRLRRHLHAHEGREKHRCRGYEGCTETFRKHETLKRHVLTVHENKKPFPCEHLLSSGQPCDQAFDTAEKLKNHQRVMHDPTRFSCTICEASEGPIAYTFETWHDLQEHIQQSHLAMCEICSQAFNTNKLLTKHLEAAHGIVDPKKQVTSSFPCTHEGCTHVFTKRGNLNVHVKTVHEKKKDFVCGSTDVPTPAEVEQKTFTYGCGRSFTSKASLIEHVRVAHFGLKTKRQQREANKRAKRNAESDPSSPPVEKRRKPRKDKGIKQSSILASLSGFPGPAAPGSTTLAPFSYNTAHVDFIADEGDDWNQLSGSMTLVGDHLYHNGQGYHLVSEDGSADLAKLDDGQYIPCRDLAPADDMDVEPFFDFEHEREHIQHNIDPLLQCA